MPKKLTVNGVAEQLRKLDGNVAAVGRAFGVTRSAVANYITDHPELTPVRDEARESVKDDAESVLFRQLREGEAWAVCFFLKTQAKDRGYIERQEIEQTSKTTLEVVEEIVDAEDPSDGAAAPDSE
jgi:predicted transcriptional regulator